MSRSNEAYENLANAIISLAVDDYRRSYMTIEKALATKKRLTTKQQKKVEEAEIMISSCERFFCSQWFGNLTSLSGMYLLKKLQNERNDYAKRIFKE